MQKIKLPVRFTGQHFTTDVVLITDAIKIAEIQKNDIVLDIGAGSGFLTVHLVRRSTSVIAIENDKYLVNLLRKKFGNNSGVKVVDSDFRNFSILHSPFKVVSNIPYGITSHILKSLMYHHVEYFMGGCLVMQLEPAQKLTQRKPANPFIIFYHTFFDLELVYEVSRDSFMPPPTVKSALLKICKKKSVNIGVEMKEKYLDFLICMLKSPDLQASAALKKLFRKSQVREVAKKLGINLNDQVVRLSTNQWSGCFQEMLNKVSERYHPA